MAEPGGPAACAVRGPGPSLIAPLFFVRAMRDLRERVGQAALISAGTLLQIGVLLSHPVEQRGLGLAPDLLLMVVAIKHILVPLLWRSEVRDLANPLMLAWQEAPGSAGPLLAMAGTAAVLAVFGVAAWRSRHAAARWLFLGAVLAMVLSYAGSLGPKEMLLLNFLFGERYYVAPQMLFGLTLIVIASGASRTGRAIAGGFVVSLIAIGAVAYVNVEPIMASGPAWRDQVAAWRADPAQALVLWPPGFQDFPAGEHAAARAGGAGKDALNQGNASPPRVEDENPGVFRDVALQLGGDEAHRCRAETGRAGAPEDVPAGRFEHQRPARRVHRIAVIVIRLFQVHDLSVHQLRPHIAFVVNKAERMRADMQPARLQHSRDFP